MREAICTNPCITFSFSGGLILVSISRVLIGRFVMWTEERHIVLSSLGLLLVHNSDRIDSN